MCEVACCSPAHLQGLLTVGPMRLLQTRQARVIRPVRRQGNNSWLHVGMLRAALRRYGLAARNSPADDHRGCYLGAHSLPRSLHLLLLLLGPFWDLSRPVTLYTGLVYTALFCVLDRCAGGHSAGHPAPRQGPLRPRPAAPLCRPCCC